MPAKEKSFAARLKQIWQQPDSKSARAYANHLIQEFADRFPKAVEILENGLEDSITILQVSKDRYSKDNLYQHPTIIGSGNGTVYVVIFVKANHMFPVMQFKK